MKKGSFFERLAGNLRFDDNDDEEVVAPARRAERTIERQSDKRELPIKEHFEEPISGHAHQILEEEIGELPVDVYETPNEIIIHTLIAGVLPEHLSLNITRDSVTITGRREENKSISDDQYHYRELYWGHFGRTIPLPAEVEIDAAEAIERHGMLMVKLPKLDKRRKTTLKIKSI